MSDFEPDSEIEIGPAIAVSGADSTSNANVSDVVGNKSDTAETTVGTTKSLMAYIKGLLGRLASPTADSTNDTTPADVIGRKTDAAVTTVGTTKSLMAYLKGLFTYAKPRDTSATYGRALNDCDPQANKVFSAWAQLWDNTQAARRIWEVLFNLESGASPNGLILEIGTGSAGNEVTLHTLHIQYLALGTGAKISLPENIAIPANTRCAIRAKAIHTNDALTGDAGVGYLE